MELLCRKKGQTATEYLIILAVVIIIALIVVGVLGGIPGIGGGADSGSSQLYWSLATPIGVTDYFMSVNRNDSITVKNNDNVPITVTRVFVDGRDLSVSQRLLDRGGKFIFSADTPGQSGAENSFLPTKCVQVQDPYAVELTVEFNKSGVLRNFTGQQKLEGRCVS